MDGFLLVRHIAVTIFVSGLILLILAFLVALTFSGSVHVVQAMRRVAIVLVALGLAGTVVGATLE